MRYEVLMGLVFDTDTPEQALEQARSSMEYVLEVDEVIVAISLPTNTSGVIEVTE